MKKQIKEFLEINPIVGNVWKHNKWVKETIIPSMEFDEYNKGDFRIEIPYSVHSISGVLRATILMWILEFQRKVTTNFELHLTHDAFILKRIINK